MLRVTLQLGRGVFKESYRQRQVFLVTGIPGLAHVICRTRDKRLAGRRRACWQQVFVCLSVCLCDCSGTERARPNQHQTSVIRRRCTDRRAGRRYFTQRRTALETGHVQRFCLQSHSHDHLSLSVSVLVCCCRDEQCAGRAQTEFQKVK